ncbi:MAG TPA: glycosyl hydrolase, partial [Casimicrobiaceae bacterium]
SALLAIGILLVLVPTAGAACFSVGVYQDNPGKGLPALRKSVGRGVTAISTYMTAGRPISPSLIKAANRNRARLVVTWMPDAGRNGAAQPKYRLKAVAKGRYTASLRALGRQLGGVKRGAILRPMPEMNTPWYPWSGLANKNAPRDYAAAWKRVRSGLRSTPAGRRVKMLWAPYARSIPDSGANAIRAYFPGAKQVDLVGASGYNFGARPPLLWSEPGSLFGGAYATIQALAAKPFWLAETGSGATGGDKPGWIRTLASLQATSMPKLAGVLWYDVRDRYGDFRLRGTKVTAAFRDLLKGACR